MQYFITKKNIKQSIKNLSSFFKEKGFDIPQNMFLEGFSKALFYKNWNTLEGITNNGDIIKHFKNRKTYMLELEVNLDKEYIKKCLLDSFLEAGCELELISFIQNGESFHFEFEFPKSSNNFLTGMIIFTGKIKKHKPKRLEMLRINIEKENLIDFMKI